MIDPPLAPEAEPAVTNDMPRQPEPDAEALAPGELSAPEPDTAEPAPEAPTEVTPGADAQPEPEREPEPVTVGRMVADALRRAGVRWAFTVPGESFLGLLDGPHGAAINVVPTRHEGAAAFMAEAHAQLTGRPAACLGTRAVGAANLSIGIHTAYADSSPMFALVGQVRQDHRGREGFQEVDLAGTIGGLAKWAAEPHGVAEAVA